MSTEPNDRALVSYEKFLAGEPLTPELQAVRDGVAPLTEPELPSAAKAGAKGGAPSSGRSPGTENYQPSRAELVALNEMRGSEGWPVLMHLLEKRLESLRKSAISGSQVDPLRNKEAIAESWAYHGMLVKLVTEIEPMIAEQLNRLLRQE